MLNEFLGKTSTTRILRIAIIIIILICISQLVVMAYRAYDGYRAKTAIEEYRTQYPIISKLPYKTPFYEISYSEQNDKSIVIRISSGLSYQRTQALSQLEYMEQGAAAKYKINFVDFKNPLEIQ